MTERPINNRDRVRLLLFDFENNVKEFCQVKGLEKEAENCGDTDCPDLSPAYDRIQRDRDMIMNSILGYVGDVK